MSVIKRFQPSITEASLRMLRIPILGGALTMLFSMVISGELTSSISFSILAILLLYLPLIGLLYFETKNWVETSEDGLRLYIDQENTFMKWDEIANIRISRDTLVVSGHDGETFLVINYLSDEAKQTIYKTYFDLVGMKPNQSSFSDQHKNYLNWDHKD